MSVTLSNKQVLAGDLVASGLLIGGIAMKERAKAPPFQDDAKQVATELLGLLDKGRETFFLGHGGPLFAQGKSDDMRTALYRTSRIEPSSAELAMLLLLTAGVGQKGDSALQNARPLLVEADRLSAAPHQCL